MDDQKDNDNDNHHLGVNKMGKSIRKDPSNQQTLQHNTQALVYYINKTDFRSIVQQLTGLGSTSSINPPQIPNPPNSRLFKVRPAPLTQVNRPPPPPTPPSVRSDPKTNQFSVNPAESPISAYMRYLTESSPHQPPAQNQNQNPVQPSTGLFPPYQTSPNPVSFHSPASQFVLSPKSPFPLLSSNYFGFSPPFLIGSESLPPPSPGFFFPLLSPLWKNQ